MNSNPMNGVPLIKLKLLFTKIYNFILNNFCVSFMIIYTLNCGINKVYVCTHILGELITII